jgi:hypothetical protein
VPHLRRDNEVSHEQHGTGQQHAVLPPAKLQMIG